MKTMTEMELRKMVADGESKRRRESRAQHERDMMLRPGPRVEALSAAAEEGRAVRLLRDGARAFGDAMTHGGDRWGEES